MTRWAGLNSGDPDEPRGVLLSWTAVSDPDLAF